MNSYRLDEGGQRLVEENMRLVPYAIAKYIGSQYVFDEDMMQNGYLGLCIAAATYKLDSKTQFSTYAVKCIITSIKSEFRKQMRKRRGVDFTTVSLNQMVYTDGRNDGVELIELVPDKSVDVESEAISNVVFDQVKHLVPTYIALGEHRFTFDDVARKQGVSRQAVHERYHKDLKRAKRALEASGCIGGDT